MSTDTEHTNIHGQPGAWPSAGDGGKPVGKAKPQAGPRPGIETLEQFIRHAYARKGKPVALKPKAAAMFARQVPLGAEVLGALDALADGDTLLAVPRQLLLASRDVEGQPALRAALDSFVCGVVLRHPAFAMGSARAAVMNEPEGPAMADALAGVASFTPAAGAGGARSKPSDLAALRRNAACLLALWFTRTRDVGLDEANALLYAALWAPAARKLGDDTARLRAITGVDQVAELGVACGRYVQLARDARVGQDHAQREAARLRDELAALAERLARSQAEASQLQAGRDSLLGELAAQRAASDSAMAEQEARHGAEQMHLRHDLELLRGRLSRRLGDSIGMLEVGLAALRNKNPRAEVMVERAEHVVDAMRAELSGLKEE